MKPAKVVVSLLAVCTLAAAACSSSGSSTATSASSTSTVSLGTPDKATGTPVKVGFVNLEGGQYVSNSDVGKGADAAYQYANAYLGGIAGRPIQLDSCKTDGTPASSRTCADQMVNDHVQVVVMGEDANAGVVVPVVRAAGIPYVTGGGVDPAEMLSPGSYTWSGGAAAGFGAMAEFAKQKGWKSFTMLLINVAEATAGSETYAVPAFKAAGVKLTVVPIAPGTADMTPMIAAAEQQHPGAYGIVGDAAFCLSALKAMQTSAVTAPKMLLSTCTGKDVTGALGQSAIDGSYGVVGTETTGSDPEAALFRQVMATYAPKVDTTGFAAVGYLSMLGLVRAVKGLTGTVSPASILAAIEKTHQVPLPAGDGITYTCDGQQMPGLRAVCSSALIVVQFDKGTTTVIGRVDPASLYAS